jgi:hypothetical protein
MDKLTEQIWGSLLPFSSEPCTFLSYKYKNLKFCMLYCMGVKHGLSLQWTNKQRQRVYKNRVMRRIFGTKREEVTREMEKSA